MHVSCVLIMFSYYLQAYRLPTPSIIIHHRTQLKELCFPLSMSKDSVNRPLAASYSPSLADNSMISLFSLWSRSRNVLTQIIIIGSFLMPLDCIASDSMDAFRKIQQVQSSLKYIQDDIEKSGDPSLIIKEVKILLNNYQLKDSVSSSVNLISSRNNRDKALTLGKDAYEDLVQIIEYYPDYVDDMSGSRTPPQDVLSFAQLATKSADGKLKSMIGLFASDAASQ